MAQSQAQIEAAAVKAQAAVDKAQAAAKKAREAATAAKKAAAAKDKAEKAEAKKAATEKAKKEKAEAAAAKKVEAAKAKVDAAKAKELAKVEAAKPAQLTEAQNDMATQVNENQKIIVESGNSMIRTAMASGVLLTKLKEAVKKQKKEWLPWQKANLVLSERQGSKYMKLASDPKAVEGLLKEMGEDASINAITNKMGQLALTDEQVGEREAKKTKAAEAKAAEAKAAAILDINADEIDDAINACTNISDLQAMIEFIQGRIQEILAAPEAEEVDDEEEVEEGESMVDDAIDMAEHVNPLT